MPSQSNPNNITHFGKLSSLENAARDIKTRIVQRGDLPHATVDRQIQMVDDLLKFPLGRFFVEHRGANGYWTDYIINYPYSITKRKLSDLEDFILKRCPLTLATRERFKIFQNLIKSELRDNMVLASVPCGCMRDLLEVDFSKYSNFSLIGIDIDPESLEHARKLATQKKLNEYTNFILSDAWSLGFESEIDLITSNGLNVYEPDQKRVLDLYKVFYQSLKPGGILIIGVLTYPPGQYQVSEWKLDLLTEDDMLIETILFQDILCCNWRNFRTIEEIYKDFYGTGFTKVAISYDTYHIFPTVIAIK